MKFLSPIDVDGYISLITQNPGVTPTKFLIQDANGRIAFRTGQELKVDIGADYTSVLKHQVKAGVAINKGQAVYVTSADGTNMIVGLASNASEATSSKTMGLLSATVAANGFADVITEGLLAGLNTIGANAGDPVWLGTNGNLIYGLANKPSAPNHLVFIGIVTRVNANNGEIFVKAQNGFELDEIHDVDLKTTTKVNGHLLGYNGSLWVNKTIAEWLGYTPYNASNPAGYITSSGSITGNAATATNADYANAAGTASTATNANYLSILGGSGGNLNTMPYGRYYNYGSGSYWINGPSGMSYGSVYNFGGSSESVLSLQLAADINHNSTSSTRTMWFRTGNNLGFQNDWKEVLHSGNYSSYAVPLSRTITINGTSYDLSANRSWTVTASETDTLATVTARGNTTSTGVGFNNYVDILNQNSVYWYNSGNTIAARTYFDGGTFNLDKSLWVTASIYGDIFYDRNDSAYYLNPAGNSSLYYASFANDVQMNGNYLRFDQSGTRSWNIRAASGNLNFNSGDGGGTYVFNGGTSFSNSSSWFGGYGPGSGPGLSFENQGTFARIVFWGLDFYDWNHGTQMVIDNGYVSANNSFRAPIFYDSNNTGYYVDPSSTSNISVLSVSRAYAGYDAGQADSFSCSNWFRSSGSSGWYNATYTGGWYMIDSSWVRSYNDKGIYTGGTIQSGSQMQSPIFYDSNDTGFYLDPNSTTTSLVVAGAIKHSGTLARPSVQWGQSGNVTGALVIKLPGTSPGNYGMIHAVIDVYEYNSNNVCTIIIGGHNWSSQWYNYGAEVVGNTNKQVRLGIKDGRYCIVLGDGSSTWEYGQVVLRKIQNGTYYNGVMDLGGAYSIGIESDSYSWISGNLNTFSSTNVIATSAAYAPIYYDNNNTGYYINPDGTSNVNAISAGGYIFSGNYIESAGAIYGTIFYDNNNRSYYCDPHSTSFFAGLQANSNIQSPIFYDYNNTGYYLDPASSSNLLNVYVSNLTASSIVYSSATGGFASSTYAVGQRNPIWRFANADGYGLSYFQGTAGDASQDTIGFHFGTATAAGSQFKMRGDGVFFASNDIIAFSSSDRQLKDNISPIENALEKVKQIGGYTFDWNDKQEVHQGHDIGVIAQEIELVLPEVVTTRDTGFKAVKYEKIVPLLIEAIKEQQTQIEELKQLVNQLINK